MGYSYIQIGLPSDDKKESVPKIKITDLEAAHKQEDETISGTWNFSSGFQIGENAQVTWEKVEINNDTDYVVTFGPIHATGGGKTTVEGSNG